MKITKHSLIVLFSLILASCGSANTSNLPILFYGNTCPHCQDLEEKFSMLKVEEKFKFERKEVYENKANANLLGAKAGSCGLDTSKIGVPFLYAEGKCLMGIDEIEKYVTGKTGISFEATKSSIEASGSGVKQ